MQQIRIFVGIENDTAAMAKEVNDWLRESKVKVVNVFGNIAPQAVLNRAENQKLGPLESGSRRFAPSDIMLVVVYEP
jgi:hypothetical protein